MHNLDNSIGMNQGTRNKFIIAKGGKRLAERRSTQIPSLFSQENGKKKKSLISSTLSLFVAYVKWQLESSISSNELFKYRKSGMSLNSTAVIVLSM